MSEEAAFLAAIDADPLDDSRRLTYSDWLDAQGESAAAEFLQAELAVANSAPATQRREARERLWDAWAKIDRQRFHQFTQPNRMRANPTPYIAQWAYSDVPRLLGVAEAIKGDRYAALPQLPTTRLLGQFDYLPFKDAPADDACRIALDDLQASAAEIGARLPESFVAFMSSAERRSTIDCKQIGFECGHPVDPFVVQVDLESGCLRIPFYYQWGYGYDSLELNLHPSGAHCIMAPRFAGSPFGSDDEYLKSRLKEFWGEPPPVPLQHSHFVAPSFEAFVYRRWIENNICDRLEWRRRGMQTSLPSGLDPTFLRLLEEQFGLSAAARMAEPDPPLPPMTPELEAYIAHYLSRL